MNTLRQLAARIARQCAASVACAFNAVCAMQRCCAPSPSSRKFEIKFALRRIRNGIPAGFAVCILVLAGLAANDAQAQTACIGGQEINGQCECPTGEVAIENFILGFVCYSQTQADLANKCSASGNGGTSRTISNNHFIVCNMLSRNANFGPASSGSQADLDQCWPAEIHDIAPDTRLCSEVFGPDFAFPQKPPGGQERYIFNCDPDGDNGLIPATINTIGATECTCPAGQTLQDDVCACPVGQSLQYGVCIVPGVASCRGLTPATSYDSTADACVACIAGQGVLANGTCDASARPDRAFLPTEPAAPAPADRKSIDGVCQCPAGTSQHQER